ncbi:hypothetical protein B840_13050 (plasmid) [Corynebacterium marinum DSM 44953]|uniref:Uncharacterized protein n=1 Tax=Corynebacterium marinum DSM 44953 TaxID=1224162 RepID=A0A0B6TQJ4_9CORY|nr:hypothetical protein B840_13050 [Corynebacterium marinum DSM 44953]
MKVKIAVWIEAGAAPLRDALPPNIVGHLFHHGHFIRDALMRRARLAEDTVSLETVGLCSAA